MKEITCNTCGDTCIIPDKGERVTTSNKDETKMEHFRRTGHGPIAPSH